MDWNGLIRRGSSLYNEGGVYIAGEQFPKIWYSTYWTLLRLSHTLSKKNHWMKEDIPQSWCCPVKSLFNDWIFTQWTSSHWARSPGGGYSHLSVSRPQKRGLLTLKPYLRSLKTPEDQNASYFYNRLDVFAANFHNPPHYEISYVFKVLKPVWTLGPLKTPNTVNVGILGYSSKVKDV